ncbi:uncharacterized LOC118065531 [Chelonus insularis]|uniref:uncharacterized LOC118065531 n=1 Tax=Chelonus insularis TaxID=460826 RepID=UPI001588C271|nr:uncharacterized LOC118065531 [Chelonus insularis]KAG8148346.1 putative per os infectivity factor pif-4 [Chelonus insularis]
MMKLNLNISESTISLIYWVLIFLFLSIKATTIISSYPSIGTMYSRVSSQYNFHPTYFEIYDRSTEHNCDRLIIVHPFDWYIWACNGYVYVLNTLLEYDCPGNSYPAVIIDANVVKSNHLQVSCIITDCQTILNEYKFSKQKRINFNIEDIVDKNKKLTLIEVLNYLFEKYITIKDDDKILDSDIKVVHPFSRRDLESLKAILAQG